MQTELKTMDMDAEFGAPLTVEEVEQRLEQEIWCCDGGGGGPCCGCSC